MTASSHAPPSAATLFEKRTGRAVDDVDDGAAEPESIGTARDSWTAVDLGPWLRGEITRPELSVGAARRDGLRLLYPGREHAFLGETESGKTWLALACVAAELVAGNPVVYVHYEEGDPTSTVERLRLLGVADHELAANLRFVAPLCRSTTALLAMLLEPAPTLVILDGVTEGMALHRLNPREEDSIAKWRQQVIKPCTRVGAAVVQCDHVVKSAEHRGRYALGSVHKVNGCDGCMILLENAEPFGQTQRGRSHVFVTKDRPGQLRRHGRPDPKLPGKTFLAELVVDDTQTRSPDLTLHLYGPATDDRDDDHGQDSDDGGPGAELRDALVAVLARQPGQQVRSQRSLLAAMRTAGHHNRKTAVVDALDDLLMTGEITEAQGPNRSTIYTLASASGPTEPDEPV